MYSQIVEWVDKVYRKAYQEKKLNNSMINISSTMSAAIDLWGQMYENKAPWIKKEVISLGMAESIASEFARLITLEMESSITGSVRADFLDGHYQKVLKVLREQIEYGCAYGGIIIKPYISQDGIDFDYVQADSFVPLVFGSDGRLKSCVFMEQLKKFGSVYTRFEVHESNLEGVRILNHAYKSKDEYTTGHEVSLSEVDEWRGIAEDVFIEGVKEPLFGYFKVAGANIVDKKSPLGCSVFATAADTIRQLDEQWSSIRWEYKATEAAIDASETLFKLDETGKPVLPKSQERLFRKHTINQGINEKPFYEIFSPAIRDISLFNGLNNIKFEIERQAKLSYGTFSRVDTVEKTAEEIKFSKQRSYQVILDNQKELKTCLMDLVHAMDVLTTLYKLAPEGDYEVSYQFGDSIVIDEKTETQIRLQEISAGLVRPEVYLMWRYGISEEEALEMMPDTDPRQTEYDGVE